MIFPSPSDHLARGRVCLLQASGMRSERVLLLDLPEVKGDTWVDPLEAVPEIAPMTLGEVNTRVTELVELHKHDTHDLYALLEDAQDSRTRISQQITMDSQWVDLLMEDRIAHQETVLIVEEEAYASFDPSTSDTAIAAGYSYSNTAP
ncbi:hypothetical protein Tco_0220921, partial [Tanacetum coccineum]